MEAIEAIQIFESFIIQAMGQGLFKSFSDLDKARQALATLKNAIIEGRKDQSK